MMLREYTAEEADRVLTQWEEKGFRFVNDLETRSTRLVRVETLERSLSASSEPKR